MANDQPMCRDCADFGPICPNSGKPCDSAATPAAPGEVTDERERFEQWAALDLRPMGRKHPWLQRDTAGRYFRGTIPDAWEAWQARAALSHPAPVAAPAPDEYLMELGDAQIDAILATNGWIFDNHDDVRKKQIRSMFRKTLNRAAAIGARTRLVEGTFDEGEYFNAWSKKSGRAGSYDAWAGWEARAALAKPANEEEIIARFLERTGQYVTNDASREAAVAEAVQKALAAPAPASEAVAQSITIDFKQATELLEMFGGEPCEITLTAYPEDEHHFEEGFTIAAGLYAHYTECPEEGGNYLGVADHDAVPAGDSADAPVQQAIISALREARVCIDHGWSGAALAHIDTVIAALKGEQPVERKEGA
jgi:hypothetical protein